MITGYALGIVPASALTSGVCGLACVLMIADMLFRFRLYASHTAHHTARHAHRLTGESILQRRQPEPRPSAGVRRGGVTLPQFGMTALPSRRQIRLPQRTLSGADPEVRGPQSSKSRIRSRAAATLSR